MGGVALLVFEQGIGEGTQHGFGMVPAHGLQGPPTVGDINCLVPDIAEVAGSIKTEPIEHFLGAGGPREAGHGHIYPGGIPLVHGFGEGLAGFTGFRHGFFVHRTHGPVAFLDIPGL